MAESKPAEKVMNRWIVVLGAVIIQLALGTLYSWGALSPFLTPYLSHLAGVSIEKQTTVFIFGVGLLSFAVTMIFAGNIQAKIGPMKTAMLGGIIIGFGVILSAAMTTLGGVILTYGILFGAGIGIVYVVPIAAAQKWFPDKVGMITGIAVAGFGAGAFIFNYVIKGLANPNNLPNASLTATNPDFIAQVVPRMPVLFVVLGIILMVLIVAGAFVMKVPPAGWKPAGWTPAPAKAGVIGNDMVRAEIVKTQPFWILWVIYTLSALAGLLVIGSYSAFALAKDANDVFLYPAISVLDITLIGGIAALFNGLGRIVWGKIADIVTYRKAITLMLIVQSLSLFIYFFTNGSMGLFIVFTCAIIFCFGGNLSLFPTATKNLFGAKNFSTNYGIVFTAYGIAGFLGATMVQTFVNAFGGYLQLFVIVGVFSVISLGLSFILKAPTMAETKK